MVGSHRALQIGRAALFFVAFSAGACVVTGCNRAKPVASVNGQTLSEADFAKLCETAGQVNPQRGTVGLQILSQWINNTMLAQVAKQRNLYPSQADVDRRVEGFRRAAAFQGMDYQQKMRDIGMTDEAIRN